MERGPMALFGAIIAVGLGPAMWLGVQFGQVTLSPEQPPAVTSVQNGVEAPRGGSGAGDTPTDTEAIRTEPKADNRPLTSTRNARPSVASSAGPVPVESSAPAEPTATTTPPIEPDPGEVTDPPTESTTAPAGTPPPTSDDAGDTDDAPPPAEPETAQAPTGTAQA